MICAIVLLISIQFAFVNIFVSAFSGSVKVDEVAIFALKLLYVTIVRPTVLQEITGHSAITVIHYFGCIATM